MEHPIEKNIKNNYMKAEMIGAVLRLRCPRFYLEGRVTSKLRISVFTTQSRPYLGGKLRDSYLMVRTTEP